MGEVGVGASNGLFTVPGAIVLILLYVFYFKLLDAIVTTYKLSNLGVVLVNFALYSVLVTGLLHGEIGDYVLHPEHTLITTLIRIQCSFFPLFAYYFLRKLPPAQEAKPSITKAAVYFGIYMAVLSLTKVIGIGKLIETVQIAPLTSLFYICLAIAAYAIGIRQKAQTKPTYSQSFEICAWILFVLSLVPSFAFFLVLLVVMIVVSVVFLYQKSFRQTAVS